MQNNYFWEEQDKNWGHHLTEFRWEKILLKFVVELLLLSVCDDSIRQQFLCF
jgi:hypothetical protein